MRELTATDMDELEERVAQRTSELRRANEQLQQELARRKRVEEALRAYSDEMHDLYNNSPCGYHSLDASGLFTRINDTELRWLGYRSDELIGKKRFSDLITARSARLFQENFPLFKERGWVRDLEFEMLRKDGTVLPVLVSASAVYDSSGTYVMSRSSMYDITELKLAEEQIRTLNAGLEKRVDDRTLELQESQQALMNIVDDLNQKTEELENANSKLLELDRLKSMFIASMSHELRTPLNSIIGFSSIIRDEWLGPVNQEQKENLETIQRSGKHLLSLINDVIDVSKIEAGRIEARFEEFDLHDLLTEAVQYLEKDIREKGLELTLQLEHHPLCTDRRRLLQCVINLLSNAVKFTERGGLSVTASIGGGLPRLVSIAVGDSGIGVRSEDIPKLFEAFVRLDSPLRATAPGTGLGLYLTRKLVVDVLRGTIDCRSEEGVGSTFTLRIPERV